MHTKTTRLLSQSFGEISKSPAQSAPLNTIFDQLVYKKPAPAKGTITRNTTETLPTEAV